MAINPNATIPVMRDGDLVLWESNSILQYAADKAGNASAYPTDLEDQSRREPLAASGNAAPGFPTCYVHLVENLREAASGRSRRTPWVLDGEAPNFHKLAGIMDARLSRERLPLWQSAHHCLT